MAYSETTHPPTSAADGKPSGTLPHPDDTDLSGRAAAARDDQMVVIPIIGSDGKGTGMYHVESASDEMYRVFLPQGRCDCPDWHHRDVTCKHIRRVAVERTKFDLPGRGDPVDPYYRERLKPLLTAFKTEVRELVFNPGGRRSHPAADQAVSRAKMFADTVREAVSEWEQRADTDVDA